MIRSTKKETDFQASSFPTEGDLIALLPNDSPKLTMMAVDAAEFYFGCRCQVVPQENLRTLVADRTINFVAVVKPNKVVTRWSKAFLSLFSAVEVGPTIVELASNVNLANINARRIITLHLPQTRFFLIPQVSAICGTSDVVIRKQLRIQQLKGQRVNGQIQISREDLVEFLQEAGLGPLLKLRRWLTVEQAAQRCNIEPREIRALSKKGFFPTRCKIVSDFRLLEEEVMQFLSKRSRR